MVGGATVSYTHLTIMSRLDTKAFGLKKTSRIKAFVFRFISVPAKWIMTARQYVLNTAKHLLTTTSFSPQQICDQIGIANVSYFYRQLKKSSGVTPQQYRERHFHG